MSCCFILKAFTAFLVGICFLTVGCGKKPESEPSVPERARPPITEVENYLAKQNVTCEAGQGCPTYIAKLVVIHGDKYRFCTGFLTESNVLATSASCLPNLLQLSGQDCSQDVFVFFPQAANRPAERVGCSQVLQVSQLDGHDPVLWRDDLSFLQLSQNMTYRRRVSISRDGVLNGRQFTTWMLHQMDDYSSIIKRSTCEAIHSNYINPLVINESSPNMLFGDCVATNGSSGAPLIDSRGKVRAMLSKMMDTKLRNYLESTGLLFQGLREMVHATNFACAPTLEDNDMLDERECLKSLDYLEVDRMRSDMLSPGPLFSELRLKLEASLADLSKHMEFGVKLISQGDIQEAEIYPKCFKPLSDWLGRQGNRNTYVDEIQIPVKSFRRTMDSSGRIQGIILTAPDKDYFFQYSLKNLRSAKKSSVLMWSGDEELQTFPNVSEECPASLF
jgi:hypothetical protein